MGLDPFVPDKVITSYMGLFRMVKEPGADNPQSLLFGKADLLFNVTFIVSLAALIFTFNSISGEKEKGTLCLVIANSIPRSRILLSKIVGKYVALSIPFIVSVLISLLILEASRDVSIASSQVWPAFLVIMAVTLLFILGMVSLGICISTFTKHSMGSILLALFTWAMLVVGVPKVSPIIADGIYPIKAANIIGFTERLVTEDIEQQRSQERKDLFDKCCKEFGVRFPHGIPSSPETEAQEKAYAKYDREVVGLENKYEMLIGTKINKIEQDYRNRRNVQRSIAVNLARMSLVSCYAYIVSGLSGTGVTEADNFIRNAQRYQNEVKETIYDNFHVKVRAGVKLIGCAEGFDETKASIPDMMYAYPTISAALRNSWIDILLLGLFDVLFCSLAFLRLNKYDVR